MKLELDVNHDGTIDRTFAGPDNTSQARPFVFWINNDYEPSGKDLEVGRDYDDGKITATRDLEDFARLWISGLPALPASNGYSATLGWRSTYWWDAPIGAPKVKIYPAADMDGGIGYLTNATAAQSQLTITVGQPSPGQALGEIAPGQALTFPADYFAQTGRKHFLFEGSGIGSGELVLTIAQGTNVVGETSVWLDLRDVKDMYERAHIENVTDSSPNTFLSTYKEDNVVAVATDEQKEAIVFVHGWRMGQWDYYSFSESMFKRLYWQGYQGRFATVRWPTLSQDDFKLPLSDLFTYNQSELRAFKSARGVSDYLNHLKQRFPDYSVNICAHSMGNIVMMEALKRDLSVGRTNVNNYVLMQAAVPAHCYDTNLANYSGFFAAEQAQPTPDTYRGYPGAIHGAVGNRIVNFYNTNDYALATGVFGGLPVHWEKNQISYKPDYGYNTDGTNSYKDAVLLTDKRDIMSFVSRPRSKAAGAQPGVGGVIVAAGQVDLKANYGFNTDVSEHSAQYNWNIQRTMPFYQGLLNALFPPD